MEECLHKDKEEDLHEGCLVCVRCGAVFPVVNTGAEWRGGIEDKRIRADVFDYDSDDGVSGTYISGSGTVARIHKGLSTNRTRLYREGKDYIRSVGIMMSLSATIIEEAVNLMKILRELHTLWRGSRRIGLLISCISIACKKHSVGVSDTEILSCPIVKQPTKVLNRQKKLVLQALHEKRIDIAPQSDASEFSFRVCSRLGYDRYFTCRVSSMTKRIQKHTHMQSKPCAMIVASSILLLAERNHILLDIHKLCAVCSVTRPTLSKWYSDCTGRSMPACRGIISNIDIK